VLDDVLEKEAGAKPRLTTQSGGVGSGVRHLSQDELDAYVNGRLPAARLDSCSIHLDSCDACRAELEDLRAFKNSAVGASQSGSLGRELDRRRRQRQLKAAGSAAIVAGVVAAIAAVGWWQFGKSRVQRTSAAVAQQQLTTAAAPRQAATQRVAQSPAPATSAAQPHGAKQSVPPPAAVATTAGPPRAPATTAASPRTPAAVATIAASTHAPAQAASAPPAPMPKLPRVAAPPAAASAATPTAATTPASTFALLGPFGDEITDARPEFAWQPLAGATKYSVVIVDEGLRPVQHSHGVKTTSWRPRRPLRRGRTYLWQVTATLRNGTKIVAMSPTSLEARIHIVTAP
jgi:hypothetical protein